jgi:hypothetical protein
MPQPFLFFPSVCTPYFTFTFTFLLLLYLYAALYHQPLPPPPPEAPDRVPEIDAVDAAEAPLRRLLALASVVGLPQQIEREEANMLRGRPVASLVTQGM